VKVKLVKRSARWKVALRGLPGVWRVKLVASDGEQERDLSDPTHWFTLWPWTRARWRLAIPAVVKAFPPGRSFSVRDVQRALPKRLRGVVGAGDVAYRLGRLWEEGKVVKLRRRRWAVPAHPDFSAQGWRTFLEEVRREGGGAPAPGHQETLSRAYHLHLWEERIRGAETVEALQAVGRLIWEREPSPEVRERLRSVYRRRMRELKRRWDGPRTGDPPPGADGSTYPTEEEG